MNPLDDYYSTVAPWPGQDDGQDGRKQRGFAIAALVEIQRSPIGYKVPSQSGRDPYTVVVDEIRYCSCPDHELTQDDCKHIHAVLFLRQRESASVHAVYQPPVLAPKVPMKQDKELSYGYVRDLAKTTEVDNVKLMLRDICNNIIQPPQGRGRPTMPLCDMAYNLIWKIFRGMSSRRYTCDNKDVHRQGMTTTEPHYNTVCKYMESALYYK